MVSRILDVSLPRQISTGTYDFWYECFVIDNGLAILMRIDSDIKWQRVTNTYIQCTYLFKKK